MFLPQQNPVDSTLPESFPVEDAHAWAFEIGDMLDALFDPASAPLLGMGNNLWTALASIVVVWTGARIAFAGASFRPWDLITLAIGLTIPLGMLRFYAVDLPGVGMPFPQIIPAGADQIAQAFHADVATELQLADAEFSEGLRQTLDAAFARGDRSVGGWIEAMVYAVIGVVLSWTSTMFFGFLFRMAFLLLYAVCLAQVLWAQVALGILVYLGPVLIPWLVWKPMAFLFWGWFRAIWTYSLYSIIAAAVLRIYGAIAITMIETLNTGFLTGAPPTDGPEGGHLLMAIVPLVAAAFMAALKVPELASAIVGGPSGGGIAGAASMAMAGGKARLARMAAGGVK